MACIFKRSTWGDIIMNEPEKIKLDNLVESYTFGFGRVVELLSGGFGVKYPHREKEVYYSNSTIREGIVKIHAE